MTAIESRSGWMRLHGRKRSLAGRRPIDMLAEGFYGEVLDAVERLHAGGV